MKINEGDIFTLHAIPNRISIGQILLKSKYNIYIVVFKRLYQQEEIANLDLNKAINDEPIIVGRTDTLFFKHKRWSIIGSLKPIDNTDLFPNYKIETAYHDEIPMDKDYQKLTYDFIRRRSNVHN